MDRHAEIVNASYDKLMFAPSAIHARRAARELIGLVLGEEALDLPLEQALREVCRELRPSADGREQVRFEEEFIELLISPTSAKRTMAA